MKKLIFIFILIGSHICSIVQADTITGSVVRITDDDLLEGAVRSTMPVLSEHTLSANKVLVF